MITAIVFIAILGVLVFVHELGHFLTAIRNGIRAEEFGFGFPPRIFGFQKYSKGNKKKWRLIWGRYDGDDEQEISDHKEKQNKGYASGTIYSLNWIPLGGFVRIKGENGDKGNESDSFAAKQPWVRIKVLIAGVLMNFLLAWVLFSVILTFGAPESIDPDSPVDGAKIMISYIQPGSPAEKMGLQVGDEILKNQPTFMVGNLSDIKSYIDANRGQEIKILVKKEGRLKEISGVPRQEVSDNEGALGIGYDLIVTKKYPWYQAIWNGLVWMANLTWIILTTFAGIIANLFAGKKAGVEVAGPTGIYLLTKQVAAMGFIYILQLAAILSVNLGIINALPIPALDGGRILFILIEKIKGRPISQKIEQAFHTVSFILLILLMVIITIFSDIPKIMQSIR